MTQIMSEQSDLTKLIAYTRLQTLFPCEFADSVLFSPWLAADLRSIRTLSTSLKFSSYCPAISDTILDCRMPFPRLLRECKATTCLSFLEPHFLQSLHISVRFRRFADEVVQAGRLKIIADEDTLTVDKHTRRSDVLETLEACRTVTRRAGLATEAMKSKNLQYIFSPSSNFLEICEN